MAGKTGARGFGHLRKLPSGRWQASYIGPDMLRHKAPMTFEAKEDGEEWLAARRREIIGDDWTPPRKTKPIVFRDYATKWLQSRRVKGEPLKPRTRYHYEKMLEDRIYDTFGDLPLKSITSELVGEWYAGMSDDRPTAKAHAYGLLRSILATAASEPIGAPLLRYNPCHIRGAGNTKRAKNIEPATLTELETIVAEMPERYKLMVLLAAWCALRFGELTELRRGDIDLTNGVVKIRRAVIRVDGEFVIGPPKSDAGTRDVRIPPHLLPFVKEHLRDNITGGRDGLLFPARHDPAEHMAPSTLYKPYYRAREVAGRPDLSFHALRHTGAVLAAQTGATLAELMARLGHSTVGAAMRYQHAAEDRDVVIAERLSEIARGVSS